MILIALPPPKKNNPKKNQVWRRRSTRTCCWFYLLRWGRPSSPANWRSGTGARTNSWRTQRPMWSSATRRPGAFGSCHRLPWRRSPVSAAGKRRSGRRDATDTRMILDGCSLLFYGFLWECLILYVCGVAVFVFLFCLGLMFGDLKMLLISHPWKCGMVIPGWSLFHLYLGRFPFDDFVQEHGSATNKGNDVIIATPECFRTLDLGWGLKATWNKSNSIQGLKTLGKIKYVQLFVRQLVLSATNSDLKLLCHAGMG